jgi:hypothetical protein
MERRLKLFGLVVLVIFISVFAYIIENSIVDYKTEGLKSDQVLVKSGVDPDDCADRIDIEAIVQSIDAVNGDLTLRINYDFQGSLVDNTGRLTTDVVISTGANPSVIKMRKGDWVNSSIVTLNMYNGNVSDYPFDVHYSKLDLFAYTHIDKTGEKMDFIPITLYLRGYVSGFLIKAREVVVPEDSKEVYTSTLLTISRSKTTKGVAIFIMIMFWVLSLAVFSVTMAVVFFNKELEFAKFSWIAAMLFAFFSFRTAAPGVPPIGGYIDFVSFFWALTLLAISLVVLVITYLVRKKEANTV